MRRLARYVEKKKAYFNAISCPVMLKLERELYKTLICIIFVFYVLVWVLLSEDLFFCEVIYMEPGSTIGIDDNYPMGKSFSKEIIFR
jgi:hypothetical protein